METSNSRTAPEQGREARHTTGAARLAYFVSDSTGITAETLGSALLANFPGWTFERHTIPFIDTTRAARELVGDMRAASRSRHAPIVFATVKSSEILRELEVSGAFVVDLLRGHLRELEVALGTTASEQLGQYHGVGDIERYFARMRAVEYAIEHDDGQSVRSLDSADVIIIAPSRCGKTPATMYLALQYGLLVANYPLTDDDFPGDGLPQVVASHAARCFGLTTTPLRLSQVRHERRPNSTYSSLAQCTLELRRSEDLYRRNRVPFLNSSTKSVEEMSAVIMQSMRLRT
ncbi:pyruvate, water dikinase regulatory protein [Microbacterium trichothecenolyticum]|uniref:Putative phosphoenolpyruvate synthase regulatory protein n=1 Tax=Microbacterium trichothecenolyticum TaxID=69370 RepID=A0A0M2HDN7_MICTR|nr:pyruvate, phosphate dikinase/phosphoenolpyruvate synthase regulator [Microbacterium trichothecenolyticum]KJL42297.1 Phosphoenolpyruvate synthase regulatory protein [Microbacterium trichothecenolyticum]